MNTEQIYDDIMKLKKNYYDNIGEKKQYQLSKKDKEFIHQTLHKIFELCDKIKTKDWQFNNDPYICGINEAIVKTLPGFNRNSINLQKIRCFLFDIDSYVNFHRR